jgi:hypothetical protein
MLFFSYYDKYKARGDNSSLYCCEAKRDNPIFCHCETKQLHDKPFFISLREIRSAASNQPFSVIARHEVSWQSIKTLNCSTTFIITNSPFTSLRAALAAWQSMGITKNVIFVPLNKKFVI